MKIRILYRTEYRYSEPVTFSQHLFRLFPKVDQSVRVHSLNFQTNVDGSVNFRRDLFDNEVASCFYPEASSLLTASLDIELEVQPKNAFGFLLDRHALELPLTYQPAELRVLQPYLQTEAMLDLPFWKRPATPRPATETLVALVAAIHTNLGYERRDEGRALSPLETLRRGSGACRDFAVLLVDVLRGLGLAARLASGYLCEFGDGEKVAEGALHAWVEAYLPGAGWIGLDPTNGTFCDHHHLTAAVGLTPDDISPMLGNYYHPTLIPTQEMSATLSIQPHE
jgi:transglutaminase-like putative cysteine protease